MNNPIPKIRILVAKNPKKPGSKAWHRFNLYKDGMTTGEFLWAGGTREDLHYDTDPSRRYIEITTLDNRPNGTAAQPNSNRSAALKRIQALLAKTAANGCTEEEAFAAAQKAGELMDKYGIESSETELRTETCVQGTHGAERAKPHESKWVANEIGKYCDCRVWHKTGTGQIVFFGMPADAEVATYMMRVVEGAMDRSWKEFKHHPDYPHYETSQRVRATFMSAMASRINARLREMRLARHTETLQTTTGQSLVLVKTQIVNEQLAAANIKLSRGKTETRKMAASASAVSAGQAAGNRVHLGTAVTGHTARKLT